MTTRKRVFFILQYEKNPKTGEDLYNEDLIKDGLDHKTIKRWAYICHDKDVWREEDEAEDVSHETGKTKPRHWHIIIDTGNSAVDVNAIAKWFSVPANMIDLPRGAGAFLDCVEYLVHETASSERDGKYHYDDAEVKANFDWRTELVHRAEMRAKYGVDALSKRDALRMKVLRDGMTMKEAREYDPVAFANDYPTLMKMRGQFLSAQSLPDLRMNFYISGKGGIGKGVCSRIWAQSLFPDLDPEDCYFEVGAGNATFDGYDGQPVIIWHDMRGKNLLKMLGGKGNFFNVFDTHPSKVKQSVKFSTTTLLNRVNIIDCQDSYEKFRDDIIMTKTDEEKEDPNQVNRRFPIIAVLHESDFDMYVNSGFVDGSYAFDEYRAYEHIKGNFGALEKALTGRARDQVATEIAKPLVAMSHELEQKTKSGKIEDPEKIPSEFAGYGKQTKQSDVAAGQLSADDFDWNCSDDNEKKQG